MKKGAQISLAPMGMEGCRLIYDWLFFSNKPPQVLGCEDPSQVPVPTFQEFAADYPDFYFDGSRPEKGRCYYVMEGGEPAGQISYTCYHLVSGCAELDIWLDTEDRCGRGVGTRAIALMVKELQAMPSMDTVIIRPSILNERAIRAYSKVGFFPYEGDISKFYADLGYLEGDWGAGGDIFMIRELK